MCCIAYKDGEAAAERSRQLHKVPPNGCTNNADKLFVGTGGNPAASRVLSRAGYKLQWSSTVWSSNRCNTYCMQLCQ